MFLRLNTIWGPAELQNAKKNHDNLIWVFWSVIYTFLCKQNQKQTLPSKWKKYCTADVSIFSKPKINRVYLTLKQTSSSKNTKKININLDEVFNNCKITRFYTEEMCTYKPEGRNLVLEERYAELRKTNGTD